MKEKLTQYIDLLFAGATQAEDIRQEILQNTLDRYDDLISQGKTPEAAYSLAISGIGDIHELLENAVSHTHPEPSVSTPEIPKENNNLARAVAIAFFILCPVPVLILGNTIGICLLLAMVAAGVSLLVLHGRNQPEEQKKTSSRSTLEKILIGITWGCGISIYLTISFLTQAWYITWLVFPITSCICGIIKAIFTIRKNFLRSVICIAILLIVIAFLTIAMFATVYSVNIEKWDFSNEETMVSEPFSLNPDEIRNVKIEWVSGDISIQAKEDIRVIEGWESGFHSEQDAFVWSQQGDTLIIQYCKPAITIGIFNNALMDKDLTLHVPADWVCNELEIDSVSATVSVSGIHATTFDLVNVSGNCTYTGCTASELDAETVSGKIHYSGSLQELDFNTVSADCSASLETAPQKVNLESVSGDMELTLPNGCGYQLDLDTTSGDFTCSYSNDSYSYGDLGCKITADTVSGDVTVYQNN